MRKMVWFTGPLLTRLIPVVILGYMAAVIALALIGFSQAISVMAINGKVIVLDPGHGGYDPGAISPQGIYEKDINLAIAKRVKAQLASTGAKVVLTREDDRDFVVEGSRGGKTRKQTDLNYRIEMAERLKAGAIVSIHVNATPSGSKSGAETFFMEGSAPGKALAESIQAELRKVPSMGKRIAKPGRFYLSRKTQITTVIVETGYLSNPGDRQKLRQEWYQDELAKAIARGINLYFGQN
ncbi:MAG TPA: N-acetylmuramoyl-L-alanine amidase [Desulfobacteria bacterium]|nr:N-acetylmuramoyl-L-alanine amidase [Desulfobacteria bacterium]